MLKQLRAPVRIVALACVLACACEPQATLERATPIAVTDDNGRTIRLEKPAERVVCLLPTITDLIVALGEGDRLIARTDYDTDSSLAHLPSIGGGLTPSVEWLAAQKPDLVISWPDRGTRSLVDRITAVGIPVYSASTDTIANTYSAIRNLGVLLGAEASADSLIASIRGALDSISNATRNRRKVRAAYLVSVAPPTVVGPRTFINELITIAGGTNVFGDISQLYTEINLEELIRRDPDVIIVAREEAFDARAELRNLPGWRDLRAVRTGRVQRVSAYDFNRSGPAMPAAARTLAQIFEQAQ